MSDRVGQVDIPTFHCENAQQEPFPKSRRFFVFEVICDAFFWHLTCTASAVHSGWGCLYINETARRGS